MRIAISTIGFALLISIQSMSAAAGDPLLIEKPDAFQTLVNPQCSHCVDEAKRRSADLRDDDRVLAWIRGNYDGGAIPYRFFLNPYRVISDTYGVFVYDPDAGFARGFEPSLDFTFHGWRRGVMVMKHKDGTLFSTLSGRAFAGPRAGERLVPVPTLNTTWGAWNAAYASTVAYHMFEKYQPLELPTQAHPDSVRSRGPVDARLSEDAEVLGVEIEGHSRTYCIADLKTAGGLIRDELNGTKLAVVYSPVTNTAVAFAMQLDAQPDGAARDNAEPAGVVDLKLDAADTAAPFVDATSGSRFDVTGRAVAGSLKGRTLRWLDGVQCRWFAVAAEYTDTSIYAAGRASVEKKTP